MPQSSHSQPASRAARAFTLIEAVLALAILGISVFVLVECTARCLAVIRSARHYQTARQVLDQGELEYPLSWTNDLEHNRVAAVTYPNGYTFARDLTAVDGEENLFVVVTRVGWSESGRASWEEVVSYLYSPQND
ncbi:MAG: prepilin-type N-terminal cleavage/methylation domain-containing protein [Lentisphaerae bacterium]|nr:prepilin-type N-terminal cleavage/methylation domain-containing protein [Lentisphaerota bacterium]